MKSKKFVVEFWIDNNYSGYCPETMYYTEKALFEFLERFEKEFKETCKCLSFKKEGNKITIDGDFGIIWKEYQPPKYPDFVDELSENIEVSFSNGGYEDTYLVVDMY